MTTGRSWRRVGAYAVMGCMVALVAMLSASSATANAFRNPPPNAAGLAQDGGKIAFAGDPSAVAVNPANLTEVPAGVQVAATFIYGETQVKTPIGNYETTDDVKILPNLFGVIPFGGGAFAAGIGLTTPFGQSVEWPESAPLAAISSYSEMRMVDISPCIAARVNDRLSIGGGLDVYLSDLELRAVSGPGAVVKLTGDGSAVGANVAATFKATDRQRLALTYRLPFSITYSGDTEPGVPAADADFETEIDFPAMAVLGYGIQLTDTIRLAADVEWVQFSRNENLNMDYGIYSAVPDFAARRTIPQDWDDIWTFGAAGAWQVTPALALRASYKYMESPIPDATLSPSLPDADKHVLSVGFGWKNGKDAIDVGYMLSLLDDRTVMTPVGPGATLPTTYELSSQILGFNYTRTF